MYRRRFSPSLPLFIRLPATPSFSSTLGGNDSSGEREGGRVMHLHGYRPFLSPSSITHTQTFHSKDLIIIFWRGAPFSLGSIPTMKLWRHSYFFPPPTGILVVFILHSSFVALTSCYGIACMNSARSFGIPPLCPYVVQQTSAFRTIFLQCSTKY